MIMKLVGFVFDKNDSLYRPPAAKNNSIFKMYLLLKALGIWSNNYIMGLQKSVAHTFVAEQAFPTYAKITITKVPISNVRHCPGNR